MNDDKDYLYDSLCKMFPEENHNLIYLIIYEISNAPIKSELFLFESLIRKIITRDELKLQAKNVPYIVNTATTVKVNPIFKAIDDLDENIRILCKDLAMSKVSLKQYSTTEMLQDMEDEKTMVGSVDLILAGMKGATIPTEVEEFVRDHSNLNGECSKKSIIDFCNENAINVSFLKYIKQTD